MAEEEETREEDARGMCQMGGKGGSVKCISRSAWSGDGRQQCHHGSDGSAGPATHAFRQCLAGACAEEAREEAG